MPPAPDAAIRALREQRHGTRRATVAALEEILYTPFPVLDHGFVRVVDYMGDDGAIVQAARVSYGRGTRRVSLDRGLIRYLMRQRHTTPFEMCEVKLHVKLPIFVARQWIRHRTANVNEYSARYSILDREFYVPEAGQVAAQSTSNRQGRGDPLESSEAARVLALLREDAERAYGRYEEFLNERPDGEALDPERSGLARELARMSISLNFYTQWYWKIDLHNLLHFLSLRADAHAQYEIRVYAETILDEVVSRWVPAAYEAFCDYRLGGAHLSRGALEVVRELVAGRGEEAEALRAASGLAPREWRELVETLGLAGEGPRRAE
ncbi:MAG: FAD-dependent thymidylate synthase [Chloroflexi bacterium]|nr:FAD-dependent thymidylate synthase [Chloroflexota bacterium]